jgi:flagellar assembly protein FliH
LSRVIKFAAVHGTPIIINNNTSTEAIEHLHMLTETTKPSSDPGLVDLSQKKAEQIIAKAEKQAEECLAKAKEESIGLRQSAHDEGYKLGYDEGFSQGKTKAENDNKQIMCNAVQKAQDTVTIAQNTAQEMVLSAERQIVDIAMNVARKILAREIEENPMVILPIVNEALEKVKNQEKITIRVNADDYSIVLQAKNDFQILIGREGVLNLIVDQTIESGSCMIDTPYGTVDARLDTKFEMIEKALQEVLP